MSLWLQKHLREKRFGSKEDKDRVLERENGDQGRALHQRADCKRNKNHISRS